MTRLLAVVLGLACTVSASAGQFSDGLDRMSRMRDTTEASVRAWKAESRRVWQALQQDSDEDTLELVGRWPWAGTYRARPSCNFANDSLVYVSSGSGIRILKASNPRRPQMVGQVNCHGSLYLTEFETKDTLLYVVYSYSMGLQVFSVADPSAPYELGRLELNGDVTGLGLRDSYAFVVGWDSLFRVIDVSNPRQPRQVRTLALPLDGLSVDVKGNYAYVGGSFAGLVAVDVTDPLNPRLGGQVGGFDAMSVVCDAAQPYIYVASREAGLQVISIANPGSPSRVGSLSTGDAWDVFKADTFVYLVGAVAPYQSDLFVVNVANPSQPRLIGQSRGDGWTYGVCATDPFGYAYTCDGWEGIHVRSLANPGNPVVDTAMYGAWTGEDLAVLDSMVYYCNSWAGLKVLSVTSPQRPIEIGQCDTVNRRPDIVTVAVADSFAYTMWLTANGSTYFRSIDITDPRNPIPSGGQLTSWDAKAIVLRDTLAFVAEDYKFEVYSTARPRQPVRIGRCDLTNVAGDLVVRGDYAYVAPSLQIVNIADPTQPWLASTTSSNSGGLDVVDTFAYCAAYGSLETYSVANPLGSRRLTTVPIPGVGWDVEVSGATAYVGCGELQAFDISDRVNPRLFAHARTPYFVRKIRCIAPYVYTACMDGGCAIFRCCSTGVSEQVLMQPLDNVSRPWPNPAADLVWLDVSQTAAGSATVSLRNVAGRRVREQHVSTPIGGARIPLDVTDLPDGCYFVTVAGQRTTRELKFVVSRR